MITTAIGGASTKEGPVEAKFGVFGEDGRSVGVKDMKELSRISSQPGRDFPGVVNWGAANGANAVGVFG